MSLNVRQIPVFAFPNSLKFYLASRSTHTQLLTLYSPYDFPVRFKVHCHSNAWDKYTVTDAEGSIAPQSSVDLVVTHKIPLPTNCNVVDKFKIVILDHVTDQVIGRKYVESILLPGEKDHKTHDEDYDFHNAKYASDKGSTRTVESHRSASATERSTANNYLITAIIAACSIILFLPTQPEVQQVSNLPSYLHVSHKVQLLAAMLLGVFLCILIRS